LNTLQVLHKRFPEGEAAIAKNTGFAYKYAKLVIEGRFPPGEKAIATSDRKPEYEWRFNVKL
jgi:hypothetical protein